jgi:hypothetical protein
MKIIGLLLFMIIIACPVFAQEAKKIHEFGNTSCEDYLATMSWIAANSQNEPTSKIYVLVYEGKEYPLKGKTELSFPAYGSARAKIRSMKQRLSLFEKTSLDNFVFIQAGFRENLTIEFWQVPVGATPPKPTPTLIKMKYRKGKAKGFCFDCC